MNKHLAFLRKVKSVAFATSFENKPSVRIVDVMLHENDALYFTTARGKKMYEDLKANPHLSIVGMDATYKTVRASGEIEFLDRSWVDKIFDANPMLNDLYPGEKRDIMEAFRMKTGEGEMFDLSVSPPVRESFTFGEKELEVAGYQITDACTACGACIDECPVNCITAGEIYNINKSHCLECGRCVSFCPSDAIEKLVKDL